MKELHGITRLVPVLNVSCSNSIQGNAAQTVTDGIRPRLVNFIFINAYSHTHLDETHIDPKK